MTTAGWDLTELTGELIEEVRARGLSEGTVDDYGRSCEALLRIAGELGATEWSPVLSSSLAKRLGEMHDEGKTSDDLHRTHMRTWRMLASLALTGEVDFSRAPSAVTLYPVSEEAARLVEEMLDEAGLGDGARVHLRPIVRHLVWYAAERDVEPLAIDDALVMDFIVHELPGTNPCTTGRAMRAIRVATGWLRDNGGAVLRDYSALGLCLAGEPSRVIPAFSEEEVGAIVGAIDASTPKGKRDLAFVLLAYCTGLRGADIVALRLGEIDWRRRVLTTTQSKTHETITCVLNGETMNALADYVLEVRPESEAKEVFLSMTKPHGALGTKWICGWFDRLCSDAGVRKLPGRAFHSIRRAFESTMVSKGVAIETASQMMGHKTVLEDKPYITCDAERTSRVSMGFGDVPIRAGAYASAEGGAR